jgi:RNA-directed DNA polymerase
LGLATLLDRLIQQALHQAMQPLFEAEFSESRYASAPEAALMKIAEASRKTMREGRGKSLKQILARLNPVLRGGIADFRLTKVKGMLEELDGWIRRKPRTVLWRQWKRVYARARSQMRAGLSKARAWQSATNGRGRWWNGGAWPMNASYPKT